MNHQRFCLFISLFVIVAVHGLSSVSPVLKSSSTSSSSNNVTPLPLQSTQQQQPQQQPQQSSSVSLSSWQNLRDVTVKSSGKRIGSGNYRKAWITWSTMALDCIRHDLQQHLPHAVDDNATLALKFKLGVAADVGVMPSFQDCGSRSGYALDFLACRVRRLSDLIVVSCHDKNTNDKNVGHDNDNDDDDTSSFVAQAVNQFLFHQDTCHLTSIGGGPGFDYTALCLAAAFQRNNNAGAKTTTLSSSLSTGAAAATPCTIHGTVFDYEPRWGDLVESLSESTHRVLSNTMITSSTTTCTNSCTDEQHPQHSCNFGGRCDITLSLDDVVNHGCRDRVKDTHIFVCQYCVAENAIPLRESKYIFFRTLFERATQGSLFIFTETTHRLWPDFVTILMEEQQQQQQRQGEEEGGFEVEFIKNRSLQLLIRKRKGAMIHPGIHVQCDQMRQDAKMHERKLQNGHIRQIKKDRGGKY